MSVSLSLSFANHARGTRRFRWYPSRSITVLEAMIRTERSKAGEGEGERKSISDMERASLSTLGAYETRRNVYCFVAVSAFAMDTGGGAPRPRLIWS